MFVCLCARLLMDVDVEFERNWLVDLVELCRSSSPKCVYVLDRALPCIYMEKYGVCELLIAEMCTWLFVINE